MNSDRKSFVDNSRKGKIILNNLSGSTREEIILKPDKLSAVYISASHGREYFSSLVKDLS